MNLTSAPYCSKRLVAKGSPHNFIRLNLGVGDISILRQNLDMPAIRLIGVQL